MRQAFSQIIVGILVALVIASCANRGTPSGGIKDIIPPKITKSEPENYTTNFTGNEIKIYFDEYIKIKNVSKQLIISPPMDPAPDITPLSSASKYIKIKILDTLAPNTTYAFNFGNSIVDNNEENPYPFYKYVFSTGNYIDSLSIKGITVDATLRKPEDFISVMLYEVDSTYTDSIIYKEKPKYVTNTLDSTTTFSLENLKAGKYKLIALKDNNQDYKFQPQTDKIAFQEGFIDVPVDSTTSFTLKLFSENLDTKITRPRLVSGEKIVFPFEGDYNNMKIKAAGTLPEGFVSRLTKDTKADSLYYWYKPRLEVDSIQFNVTNTNYNQDFTVKLSEQKRDTMNIQVEPKSLLNFNDEFKITNAIPFTKFEKDKVTILDKDSIAVNYNVKLDSLTNSYILNFEKKESEKYQIQLLPEALTDFFDNKNDTLNYQLTTKTYADYGNVRVELQNATYPIIAQITDDKGDVIAEQYSTKPEPIDFRHLKTGIFYLRVIFDANKNKKYDSGNYLKNQQPERVSYYKDKLDIRANFDNIYTFTLF
ncbi:Ig-like domain-containing protein [Bizionia echini]|uniref:Ig-like domain-containing protein n=1 Tax=Bizionia echini TaxID=649333 RepID=A0A1I4YZ33_9FLAO|nr:Ig-like domain-containing protein [Bizionia echini]SFN43275.1 Ig-like domain-containing protein [Bizionia echini]